MTAPPHNSGAAVTLLSPDTGVPTFRLISPGRGGGDACSPATQARVVPNRAERGSRGSASFTRSARL